MYAVIGTLAYIGAWAVIVLGLFVSVPWGLWFFVIGVALVGALIAWGRDEVRHCGFERCEDCNGKRRSATDRKADSRSPFDML